MLGVKNLRVLAAGLCLGVTLLSGCGGNKNTVTIGDSKIVYNYENNQITGSITFEDLNSYGKVVVLQDNGEKFCRLLIRQEGNRSGGRFTADDHDYIVYEDLETGATMIHYKNYTYTQEEVWEKGKDLEIISEVGITSYLVNKDFVKTSYSVDELITFVKDNVIPSLDLNEKELVK